MASAISEKLVEKLFHKLKRKKSSKFFYYKVSITGGRENNQDECIVLELGEKSIFMAVADGMGGTANGYIAANIAINIAYDIIEENFNKEDNVKVDDLKKILSSIYTKVQENIKKHVSKNPDLNSMGTTLTSLLIHDGKYVWGNIGDSKILKLKKMNLLQLTEDHSYISDFMKENKNPVTIEIENSYGHLLTKCLDGGDDEADVFPMDKDYEDLEREELFLLCSDGLIINRGNEKDKKLIKVLKSALRPNKFEKVSKRLIDKSIEEGSTDNISIILFLNK